MHVLFLLDLIVIPFYLCYLFNTLTGSYQEIKAKRTLDQLSILTKQQIDVLRDNQLSKINVDEIVQDDLIILNTGMQIPVDCELLEGHIEANESLLTGESDAILKSMVIHSFQEVLLHQDVQFVK